LHIHWKETVFHQHIITSGDGPGQVVTSIKDGTSEKIVTLTNKKFTATSEILFNIQAYKQKINSEIILNSYEHNE